MTHFWIVEFRHPEGWTPFGVCLSRSEAREQAKRERNRYGTRWKIRVSKATRAGRPSGEGK